MSDAALDSFTTFGELLKHLRQRAHLTQDEFGLAVGYSRAHVARLESGQRTPDVGAVRAHFLEALHLKDEPETVVRLIKLAQSGREAPSSNVAPEVPQHLIPNNLPIQVTSFVGRDKELAELGRLLPETRLLTLTGSGRVGKTRLALEVGAAYVRATSVGATGRSPRQTMPQPTFSEGVWLADWRR